VGASGRAEPAAPRLSVGSQPLSAGPPAPRRRRREAGQKGSSPRRTGSAGVTGPQVGRGDLTGAAGVLSLRAIRSDPDQRRSCTKGCDGL
jgi:hypothetical protein